MGPTLSALAGSSRRERLQDSRLSRDQHGRVRLSVRRGDGDRSDDDGRVPASQRLGRAGHVHLLWTERLRSGGGGPCPTARLSTRPQTRPTHRTQQTRPTRPCHTRCICHSERSEESGTAGVRTQIPQSLRSFGMTMGEGGCGSWLQWLVVVCGDYGASNCST